MLVAAFIVEEIIAPIIIRPADVGRGQIACFMEKGQGLLSILSGHSSPLHQHLLQGLHAHPTHSSMMSGIRWFSLRKQPCRAMVSINVGSISTCFDGGKYAILFVTGLSSYLLINLARLIVSPQGSSERSRPVSRSYALRATRWLNIAALGGMLGLPPVVAHSSMRQFLEGRWVGDGVEIRVDQDAVQANDSPDKPFEWSALNVLDVNGNMIVFDIGKRRYVGLLDGERMTVTIAGSTGSYVLKKIHPLSRFKNTPY